MFNINYSLHFKFRRRVFILNIKVHFIEREKPPPVNLKQYILIIHAKGPVIRDSA